MKEYRAVAKNIRTSVTKAKIPADVVKGMHVGEALDVLTYMNKKAAGDVLKVVKSAAANAVHNFDAKIKNLYISDVRIDKGLQFRRMKAGSRGSPKFFDLHHAHITVVLKEVEDSSKEAKVSEAKKEEVVVAKAKKAAPKSAKKPVAKAKSK